MTSSTASSHPTRPSLRVLLLGAPGAGKGTQGVRVAERYGAQHVSTGDLLRAEVAAGTPLGQQAEGFMGRGDLVPDELVLSMVLESVLGGTSPASYVLDGFPRTVAQAEAAYAQALVTDRVLDAVVLLDLDHDELLRRIVERGKASGRVDDTAETVRHRIEEYEAKTLPLVDYYAGRDILLRVDAVGTVDEVTARLFAALDALPPRL